MTSLFFSSLCRKGMQWILFMIIPFEKRESGSNSQELVFQMIGKCKIADCKLQVAGFVDSVNVTEKRRKRRETTGDRRDMLVHC